MRVDRGPRPRPGRAGLGYAAANKSQLLGTRPRVGLSLGGDFLLAEGAGFEHGHTQFRRNGEIQGFAARNALPQSNGGTGPNERRRSTQRRKTKDLHSPFIEGLGEVDV